MIEAVEEVEEESAVPEEEGVEGRRSGRGHRGREPAPPSLAQTCPFRPLPLFALRAAAPRDCVLSTIHQ
jgi:hypothetical protein